MVVTNCTFSGNNAGTSGGAIWVIAPASTESDSVSNSTFYNNAGQFGGAILSQNNPGVAIQGTLSVSNCTFSGNSAALGGGGIANSTMLTVADSTFSQNVTVGRSGGGISTGPSIHSLIGSLTLLNTIVAQNSVSGGATDPDVAGAVTTNSSNNLIGDGTGMSGITDVSEGDTNGNHVGTSSMVLNALLGPLYYNGGPTQTMVLMPGSPALGAGSVALAVDPSTGNPLTTDQRGSIYARVAGGAVDIGAFETQDTSAISGNLQNAIDAQVSANRTDPTVTLPVTSDVDAQNFVAAINDMAAQSSPVSLYLNLAPGLYSGEAVSVPTGMTLYINGTQGNVVPTTVDPDTPAFTVASGNVVVSNVTFVTTGDAPTILVTGGRLTLRNDVIQGTTGGYTDAAISVTGGTLDLGTVSDPGGNTINVISPSKWIANTSGNPITAVGDVFQANGATVDYWIGGSGDWDNGSNWSTGVVPVATDDAFIDAPGIIVSHATGTDTLHRLFSTDPIVVSGGSLSYCTF